MSISNLDHVTNDLQHKRTSSFVSSISDTPLSLIKETNSVHTLAWRITFTIADKKMDGIEYLNTYECVTMKTMYSFVM